MRSEKRIETLFAVKYIEEGVRREAHFDGKGLAFALAKKKAPVASLSEVIRYIEVSRAQVNQKRDRLVGKRWWRHDKTWKFSDRIEQISPA